MSGLSDLRLPFPGISCRFGLKTGIRMFAPIHDAPPAKSGSGLPPSGVDLVQWDNSAKKENQSERGTR